MNEKIMKIAIDEAMKAFLEGEIPVGAVIVKDNKVISKAYNKKEQLKCATKHAEILAIEKASAILDDWRLNDCEMLVTMEPCFMCCGALLQSRIKKVYYLIENEKFGGIENVEKLLKFSSYNHSVIFEQYKDLDLQAKMKEILKEFFSDKR